MSKSVINIILYVVCCNYTIGQNKYVGEKKGVVAYTVSTLTVDTRTMIGAQIAYNKDGRNSVGFRYLYGKDPSLDGIGIYYENGLIRPVSNTSIGVNLFLFGAKTWTKNVQVQSFENIYKENGGGYDHSVAITKEVTIEGQFGTVGFEFYLHSTDEPVLLEPSIRFAHTFSKNPAKYGDEQSSYNSIVLEFDLIFNRSGDNIILFTPGFTYFDKYKSSLAFKSSFIHSLK